MSKGFTNLGNTCYMNAALQCLSHIPHLSLDCSDFIKCIKKRDPENNSDIIKEWLNLQQKVWKGNKDTVSTLPLLKEFIRSCNNENIVFQSFNQNDTTDFLNTFMDLLHNSIKRKVSITITGEPKNKYDRLKLESIKSWKNFFESNYSHIIEKFHSKLLSITSCPHCNYYTTNHEPIMTIDLPLKETHTSIYDCLDEFIKEETLDTNNTWKCDRCNRKVQPHKKLNFWELSPVLIISIKQFRLNKKMNKHIQFPEELDMKNYCINNNKTDLSYTLYGLCIHKGDLNGGHYYAACRDDKDNLWRIHNDTNVNTINIRNVLNETPYCLFYIRDN
tara:strand:+ start:291 stop:1286 length:996 start_codon:yes stop_codon:yes gene_type:complete